MIEDADHNFTGRYDAIADTILDWWAAKRMGKLKTGVWMTGVRGRM